MTPASPADRPGRNPVTRWVAARRAGGAAPGVTGGRGAGHRSSSFAVTVRQGETDVVIEVTGELDIHTTPALRGALIELVAAGRARIVVDLLGVGFADSTALGVLVGGYKRASAIGGYLRIACPPGQLADVFRLTGLDGVLPLYVSVHDAMNDGAQLPPGR
jgi:anti-sigma B factor antagonist